MEEHFKRLVQEAVAEALASVKTQSNQSSVPEIMTAKQLAEYMQVSESWVMKNVRRIPRLNVVGTRFRKCDIDAWLDSMVVESSETVADSFTRRATKSKCKSGSVYSVVL